MAAFAIKLYGCPVSINPSKHVVRIGS